MKKEISLSSQLILISLLVFLILTVSLTIFLPKALMPYFDETVYNFLNQPLKYFNNTLTDKYFNENIVYIQIDDTGNMIVSQNAEDILRTENYEEIINKVTSKNGNFKLDNRKYYYVSNKTSSGIKITITDQKLVNSMQKRVFISILPIIIITFLVILIALLIWCRFVVSKIYILRNKVKNLNDDNYDHSPKIRVEDELKLLEQAIEDARILIKEQENYKNEMYQNISHDFKTPIAVIKSYIEASKDGVIDSKESREVIEEQINKLENKVKSLLHLNKLEYLKENHQNSNEKINILEVIDKCVNKFTLQNKDIKWHIICKKSEILYDGTFDMWETIIDNLLTNFMRYVKETINIEVYNKKLILFNDGESIDEDIINNIFTPYKKGMKGQFGLGLSIVKKTCQILGYDVRVENVKKGVRFIIESNNKK